jgi:hypothetical protein
MKQTGLWRGWWFDMRGHRLKRVRRPELAEAYRLYGIGTGLGLTDRAVAGAGGLTASGHGVHNQAQGPPPLREQNLSMAETNPFHEEGGRSQTAI